MRSVSWPQLFRIAAICFSVFVDSAAGGLGASRVAVEDLQQAVFSIRADMVLAHATVMDGQGQIFKGLTAADFVIKDDGVVVKDLVVMPDDAPLAVAIIMNQEVTYYGQSAADDGLAVAAVAAALRPDDVIGVSNVRRIGMELARDPLRAMVGTLGDLSALRTLAFEELARSPWDALAEASRALAEWPGRRTILFIAGSADWHRAFHERMDPSFDSRSDPHLAQRPEPRPTVSRSDVELTLQRLGVLLQVVRYDRGYDSDVDRLATAAGGRTHKFGVREPLAARVNQIVEGLRGSYLLGFKPSRLDGKTHKLDIRTVRSDLKVTGRTQYRVER